MPVAGLWLSGCGPGPMPVEVVDLVDEFRYAEVRRERPLIDLGTPSAAAALVGGWSWNETDPRGATFVWAVGPRSEVGLFVAWEVEGAAPVAGSVTAESTPTLHLPLSPVGEQAANTAGDNWLAPFRAARLGPERHGIRELDHGLEESFATRAGGAVPQPVGGRSG